jgi:hypothetical protein
MPEDFDNETQDIEEVEGDEFSEDEVEEVEDVDEGEAPGPWDWAKDLDPDDVQKTYSKFTQKTQNLSTQEREVQRMRDELAPLSRLRDQLESDPGLVAAIEGYFMNAGSDPSSELAQVKQELTNVQTSIAIEKELGEVHKWVNAQGLPDFDDDEILQHATENRIMNLKAAYRDMNFEQVQDRKAEKLTEDIKRGKRAAVPKSRRADSAGGKRKYSEEDIAAMSDEDFQKNFAAIYDSYTS